ncbi:MAG: NAD-dependent epimerase/dehydratase family protein [Proteobacteria bacterium]|jgi:nucleoside-diphosphate-sugar epimerase|nr:NAD-dependent epimerase/dehydratase family protein [Alphaproteobacteria bacterium]NCC03318.1 NAD-dependent epimerase/dehydratase family protein [Pseudomonadota bacterium]
MSLHLVTGGSGFVGSYIVQNLLARGEQVRVLDLWKADDLPKDVDFVYGDIRDETVVARAMQGVDYVHHNVALVPLSKAAERYEQVIVGGTRIALEQAQKAGVKFFAFMSSSAIFGVPDTMPIPPDAPHNPIEIYGRAKARADALVQQAIKDGFPACCIRPRTVIGRNRLGIFAILFEWIRDNAHIYVIGSGNVLFQFLHAEDLAEVSVLAALKQKTGLYNVGAPRYGTLREDLEALIKEVGSRSKVKSLPVLPAMWLLELLDVLKLSPLSPWHYKTYHKAFYFDSSHVTEALDWHPRFGNREMMIEAYNWFVSSDRKEKESGRSPHRSLIKQGALGLLKAVSRF